MIRKTIGLEKTRVRLPGPVNFALGEVKIEFWWSSGQVKLASESVLLSVILEQ